MIHSDTNLNNSVNTSNSNSTLKLLSGGSNSGNSQCQCDVPPRCQLGSGSCSSTALTLGSAPSDKQARDSQGAHPRAAQHGNEKQNMTREDEDKEFQQKQHKQKQQRPLDENPLQIQLFNSTSFPFLNPAHSKPDVSYNSNITMTPSKSMDKDSLISPIFGSPISPIVLPHNNDSISLLNIDCDVTSSDCSFSYSDELLHTDTNESGTYDTEDSNSESIDQSFDGEQFLTCLTNTNNNNLQNDPFGLDNLQYGIKTLDLNLMLAASNRGQLPLQQQPIWTSTGSSGQQSRSGSGSPLTDIPLNLSRCVPLSSSGSNLFPDRQNGKGHQPGQENLDIDGEHLYQKICFSRHLTQITCHYPNDPLYDDTLASSHTKDNQMKSIDANMPALQRIGDSSYYWVLSTTGFGGSQPVVSNVHGKFIPMPGFDGTVSTHKLPLEKFQPKIVRKKFKNYNIDQNIQEAYPISITLRRIYVER
ncbi:unnamed protein product [Ambrosiozyma monospora]|uniref:Unnamed protein product n=1 Tax=Ambrosiozyma monospora TaxID=43982 RepID=A0A9W6Z4Q9_AMBMO|nr:unnamed protein product [Ambrosiozyma monospora]